jgi:hypothetical protein
MAQGKSRIILLSLVRADLDKDESTSMYLGRVQSRGWGSYRQSRYYSCAAAPVQVPVQDWRRSITERRACCAPVAVPGAVAGAVSVMRVGRSTCRAKVVYKEPGKKARQVPVWRVLAWRVLLGRL